ncbi:DUF2637 domain-containing protein [Catenuloplanes japonicus]|uniref:DUF2637 domain-containing protein n=1 Tax=Catenuloplanes japonicus TaxID=33876 RepID=UPI0018DBBAE9|nr:DUF2637 domain-containing protein [Catenuloplanes japonicus]
MTLSQLLRIRWAVRATLLLGVAASVVANVLHAVDNPISQVIAAWPPFALLLTVELISRVPVHRKSLAFIRMLATTAIAGIAAWISYWHMAGVAAKYGETGASAYLLPVSVDGLIVVASICLIELGGRIAEEQAKKRAATESPAPETAPARTAAPAVVLADEDRYDNDVPGIAALVPRPLAPEKASTGAYPQFSAPDDEYLDDYEDQRTTADRTAAAGAMAVAAGERRDRDPLTSTGSLPVITSDVAAAIEAALSGSQVTRGVRGGASPRNRGGISAVSGSLGRPAGQDESDQAQDAVPEPGPDRVPAQRAAGPARRPARASAATSTTARRTTSRITAPAGDDNGAPPAGDKDTTTRPRRSAAETAALAAAIEARSPGITEAAVADELGISARRLRDIRRTTDTLPA